MKAHHRISNKAIDVLSLVDVKQLAMLAGHFITENKNTFNGERTYKIDYVEGLYTFEELKNRFLH